MPSYDRSMYGGLREGDRDCRLLVQVYRLLRVCGPDKTHAREVVRESASMALL